MSYFFAMETRRSNCSYRGFSLFVDDHPFGEESAAPAHDIRDPSLFLQPLDDAPRDARSGR